LLSASSVTTTRLTSSSILPERDLFPKSTLLSREFFCFQKSWRASLAIWNVSGRDYRFVAQNGLISVFSSCCVAALQACETRRLGPPSPIADPGLFLAIFRMDFFSKQLFCVVRINCFRDFLPVTVLVTVDGNVEKSSLLAWWAMGQVRVLSGRRLERRGS